eukprot:2081820-Rhodomonas_salina.1
MPCLLPRLLPGCPSEKRAASEFSEQLPSRQAREATVTVTVALGTILEPGTNLLSSSHQAVAAGAKLVTR